jgi:hypothetical protein
MNFKVKKGTRCKMCGESILAEHEDMAAFTEKMGRFRNTARLSTVRMRENENAVECHEQEEDVFFFHPDCIKSVLRANCFDWLKDD